jgi:hypothetical protein
MARKRRAKDVAKQHLRKRQRTIEAAIATATTATSTAKLYRPLRGNQFRLLTVLPGSGSQLISCRLNGHNIDTAPAFEALSYVWGDLNDRLDIFVNNEVFAVTRNLYAALRRLRLPDKRRIVWIDAICINQKDNGEKSHQVQRMAQIYSDAAQVVVWLGDGISNVKVAVLVAEAVGRLTEELAKSLGVTVFGLSSRALTQIGVKDIARRLSEDAGRSFQLSTEECWQALDSILTTSWFKRLWCFQEFVLARHVTIFAGDFTMAASTLSAATDWAIAIYHLPDGVSAAVRDTTPKGLWSSYARFNLQLLKSTRVSRDSGSLLLELLEKNAQGGVSDAKDKVYALLGVLNDLFPEVEHPITVDYDQTLAQVYLDAARACIEPLGSLEVLIQVDHGNSLPPSLSSQCPSWVPRWDKQIFVISYGHHWKASGSPPHLDRQRAHVVGRTLCAKGILLETVKSSGMQGNLSMREMPEHLVEFWNVCNAHYEGRAVDDQQPDIALARIMKMTKTWIGGRLSLGVPHFVDEMTDKYLYGLCVDFLSLVEDAFFLSGAPCPMIKASQVAATLSLLPQFDAYKPDLLNRDNEFLGWAVYNRRMFWPAEPSKHGFDFGLGPIGTQAEDVVAILYGASMPYVLRRQDDGWLLIGACYLEGVMCGELFKTQPNGHTFAEEYEEQEFTIY